MHPAKLRRIAAEALAHYLRPTCEPCRGRGQIGVERQGEEVTRACPKCKGTGRLGPHECGHCHGKGRIRTLQAPQPYRPCPCPTCGGSGRRPLPQRERREIREVLYVLEEERRKFGCSVRELMGIGTEVAWW